MELVFMDNTILLCLCHALCAIGMALPLPLLWHCSGIALALQSHCSQFCCRSSPSRCLQLVDQSLALRHSLYWHCIRAIDRSTQFEAEIPLLWRPVLDYSGVGLLECSGGRVSGQALVPSSVHQRPDSERLIGLLSSFKAIHSPNDVSFCAELRLFRSSFRPYIWIYSDINTVISCLPSLPLLVLLSRSIAQLCERTDIYWHFFGHEINRYYRMETELRGIESTGKQRALIVSARPVMIGGLDRCFPLDCFPLRCDCNAIDVCLSN